MTPGFLTLALDTALAACSVALVSPDGVLATRHQPMERGQAEALVPLIAAVMAEADQTPSALGQVAVTIGPGSFTGLRVGLATARGLGVALGCPVRGVGVAEALADAVMDHDRAASEASVLVVIDSKRGDLFVQRFAGRDAQGLPRAVDSPRAVSLDEAQALAEGASFVAGDGALKVGRAPVVVFPDPVRVARLAARRPPEAALAPLPLYLRPPDAVLAPNGGRLWA
ncbi:tRNA (adenosine(37)-N6)-threonylcarbamoyltransferase complex dimerization subunit type 1 TsaB [Pararhodospirillum photometricum]|uniref:Peptidase M22, glycoprotease n=1 Tax=Pararhodospirillum photometricum DSM 122 TaxID=1150469 RepID=H6SS95_PARPM|nr:tRNA (adenosine(37)-N6)-threonylcarbamoyltransferase complex dimerization subunit type 1 TsaB [Pararhodospirillum photometricum]CCG07774.1 Peptidase M22, glycoprotease [Pararhodospirillum photometricum DSM 122]